MMPSSEIISPSQRCVDDSDLPDVAHGNSSAPNVVGPINGHKNNKNIRRADGTGVNGGSFGAVVSRVGAAGGGGRGEVNECGEGGYH